jgi:hypothetical protein
MKWGTSILGSILLLLVLSLPVFGDGGFDYYDPATGMHYQQAKPLLQDGQLFQFCVDPGGATWACISARVRGDSWVADPFGMKDFTDEQRMKTWTVWSAKDELGFVVSAQSPNPLSQSIITQAPPAADNVMDCMELPEGLRDICVDWAEIENEK